MELFCGMCFFWYIGIYEQDVKCNFRFNFNFKNMFFRWIVMAMAFYLIAYIVPGVSVSSGWTALVLAFFWGVVNVFLKPILLFFTLPINILTLGLFTICINGFLFWLLSTFVKGFYVKSFWSAIVGAILLSLVSWGVEEFQKKERRKMFDRKTIRE